MSCSGIRGSRKALDSLYEDLLLSGKQRRQVLCPHCQKASKNHSKGGIEAENYEWSAQIAFARWSLSSSSRAWIESVLFVFGRSLSECFGICHKPRRSACGRQPPEKGSAHRMQESWSAANRLARSSTHAWHAVAFTRDVAESCTGSTWAFAHGDNVGRLYARQCECAKGCCELAWRSIVPNCSQVGERWE